MPISTTVALIEGVTSLLPVGKLGESHRLALSLRLMRPHRITILGMLWLVPSLDCGGREAGELAQLSSEELDELSDTDS